MTPRMLPTLSLLLLFPAQSLAADLRPYREITGPAVRLSDLFDDLGATPDRELGAAPAPGTQITVQSPQLAAIARDFNVDWRPRSGAERAVLARGGITLPYDRILDAVRGALANAGAPADADVTLAGFDNPVLPSGSHPTAAAGGIAYDPAAGNFTATLTITGDGMPPLTAHIAGHAYAMADVAVLIHHLRPGSVLSAQDVRTSRLHAILLHGNIPLPPGDAPGMQLRHDLAPGQPLTRADVVKPTLVARNANVRLLLTNAGITLGGTGIAIDEGGLGDHIRVQNPSSRAVLVGEITGADEVRLAPGNTPLQVAQQ